MIYLKDLTREQVLDLSISKIIVDTRAYRIWFSSGESVTKEEMDNSGEKMDKTISFSKINVDEVIPFLQRISELTKNHAVFYFKGSVKKDVGFWPLKYLNFWRINETEFSIRTEMYFDEIDWRRCTAENLVLDKGWIEN